MSCVLYNRLGATSCVNIAGTLSSLRKESSVAVACVCDTMCEWEAKVSANTSAENTTEDLFTHLSLTVPDGASTGS